MDNKGYSDGLSCCELHGEKTARKLAAIKPVNEYEWAKRQAAIDWLDSQLGDGCTLKPMTMENVQP